jgi:uncharacterized membrane protein YkoI
MRPWPLLVALALGCGSPSLADVPTAVPPPVSEAERQRLSTCGQRVVAQAEVVRVVWSRHRGRAALAVTLSSPNDDWVDAYYAEGTGCELLALVGRGPLDAEVQPGHPLRGLQEARRAALDGVVTSWALERGERDGRWAYRFDIDAEGRMHTVFVDALGAPATPGGVQRRGEDCGDGGAAGGREGGGAAGGGSGAAPGDTTALGAAMIKLPRMPASR